MKILKASQIREVDAYTIEHEPIKSIDLMERAALTITNWLIDHYSTNQTIKIFIGPGNNGGDGLAIARQLLEKDYQVEVFILRITEKLSLDSEINLERLKQLNENAINNIKDNKDFPIINSNEIIIDALFGSGLTRELSGLAFDLVRFINESNVEIISVDIPSGLFGEDNSSNNKKAIIKAKQTLSFQLPKLAFLFADNSEFVGDWSVLPIGLHQEFIDSLESNFFYIDDKIIRSFYKERKKFSHKGTFGHALIVAGSYGKMGASILAAKACLRSGSGLVTAHIPKLGFIIMQTAVPECMLSIDWSDIIISNIPNIDKYNAIGIGPGIGTKMNTVKALNTLFESADLPLVIDADALNILSENNDLIKAIPSNSILTPHPKEFERLVGETPNNYLRMLKQIEFSVKYKVFVVLKGAHTAISTPEGKLYFNSTGNAGMATAGSGDVLTGIITSLLGQGYLPEQAAIYGVYLHGKSGDIAEKKHGQEALIASDIIENIGAAYLLFK